MAGGRPLKYNDVNDMVKIIDDYFNEGGGAYVLVGKESYYQPTISGLAYALGMCTETLRCYSSKDEFSATIKAAKQKVEMALENRLYGSAVTGAIFNLKNNFGWKDKSEQEVSTEVTFTTVYESKKE